MRDAASSWAHGAVEIYRIPEHSSAREGIDHRLAGRIVEQVGDEMVGRADILFRQLIIAIGINRPDSGSPVRARMLPDCNWPNFCRPGDAGLAKAGWRPLTVPAAQRSF